MATGFPDFEGNKRGLYSQGDWSAVIAEDKEWTFSAAGKTFGQFTSQTYTPGAGKTLYIIGFNVFSQIENAADAGVLAHVLGVLYRAAAGTLTIGGDTGAPVYLNKPKVFAAGEEMDLTVVNNANVSCLIGGSIWGWEI